MATRKQKEELMETLKFTPHDATIQLTGYGGEIVIGKIDPKTANYWSGRNDLEEYANKWDNDEFDDVPEDFNFIDGSMWYEIDNLAHSNGVEMSRGCWATVTDNVSGDTLFATELDPETLQNTGCQVSQWETIDAEDYLDKSGVFVGQNLEKGLFFEATFELSRPFDPTLLHFNYSTYDGWRLLDSLQYAEEELDGIDAYSTTGKSSSFIVYECGGEEFNIDESDLGPWHETVDHDPVHMGYYDCRVSSTTWPEQRLWWDGQGWLVDNTPMRLHVSHWRGLNRPFA